MICKCRELASLAFNQRYWHYNFMLDINFIRENAEVVKNACKNKNVNCDVGKVLELDKKKRELMTEIEILVINC